MADQTTLLSPYVEDITRRGFLVGGAAALLLSGCGSDQGSNESSGETREVRSGEGSIEVPVAAKRVVTNTHGWDAAVVLGVEERIIGVAEWDLYLDYVEYLEETKTENMTPIGMLEGGANIEQIATLEPDLIVVPYWNSKDLASREELKELAPFAEMVVPEYPRPYDTWKGSLRAYAEIFGVPERAEGYIAEQEASAATLREDIAASEVAGETVHLAYYVGADYGWRVDKRSNTASLVLEDLELPRPEEPELKDGGVELSVELTPRIDADHLWVYLSEPKVKAELEENPLWQRLDAVKEGTARFVPSYWNSGYSLAIPRVIEDIRGYMLG